jgi:hypothetical protein
MMLIVSSSVVTFLSYETGCSLMVGLHYAGNEFVEIFVYVFVNYSQNQLKFTKLLCSQTG